jgi:DNA polymerase I-like protein with 3'-5' exonuclease and polymerase domains
MSRTRIKYIGEITHTIKYRVVSSFDDFVNWFQTQKILAHDVETNVTASILDRELRVIQFGSVDGKDIWVIQWSYLTEEQQQIVIRLLQSNSCTLITHTNFEYVIWRKYGVVIEKLWDTYVAEKVLHAGLTVEKGYFSLKDTLKRRFEIDISKAEQTNFGDDILTDSKIEYAAVDVLKLGKLMDIQKIEAKIKDKQIGFEKSRKGIRKTLWWENEFTKVLGDIEYQGINFDSSTWMDNYYQALPLVENAIKDLNTTVRKSFDLKYLEKEGLYVAEDTIEPIWDSPQKKLLVLSWIFPDLAVTNKVALKEFLRDNDPDFPDNIKINGKSWNNSEYRTDYSTVYGILKVLTERTKQNKASIDQHLNEMLLSNFRDRLLEHELLTPANTVTINWASPLQRMKIFRLINPNIPDTKAQTIEDNYHRHKVFRDYTEYIENYSLISKFGLDYLNHIEADGRIRTRFDQVLSTGRISSYNPNLLQLPRLQRYRDAFIASPGWHFVGADYSSEEILIIALLSNDPVWLKSFRDGDDVHSVNASLIYGEDWIKATEPNCAFHHNKQKCKCPGHQDMRNKSKAISFGLSYGLSAHGAAIRLKITKKEAQDLIDRFFKTFPNIKDKLEAFAYWGVKRGFIAEPVFGRPRFYDEWKISVSSKLGTPFEGGMSYREVKEAKAQKASIERESKNHPIQSAGAGVLKISGVLLRRWINNSHLQDKVRLLLPPHDEWCLESDDGYQEETRDKLKYYMELAGKIGLNTDLLKAEPYIDKHWVK